jgi:hypothetical protein
MSPASSRSCLNAAVRMRSTERGDVDGLRTTAILGQRMMPKCCPADRG